MKTHRKLTALVGFSLLLIMIIVTFSLRNLMTAFSSVTAETELASLEIHQVELIEKELTAMFTSLRNYSLTNDKKHRDLFDMARVVVHARLDEFNANDLS